MSSTYKSQQKRVAERIRKIGCISRNECLANYISRISAIIQNLEKKGWKFNTEYRKENGGKNYYYIATFIPERTLFDD